MEEHERTVQADLGDTVWPDLGSPDLGSSASMHHMAHPDRAPHDVHDALAPGDLFAVVELAGFPRFLPDSAAADVVSRCSVSQRQMTARAAPAPG
ncbi:hypothetical protein ACIOTI_41430 [Streptomyces sp. NPDC087843]|uniref:hypothetical protein n=1 Tax=Streptomyces sp. NPDC087843 TaxID=3365804 RepID=UPI0038060DA0